jgi:hypothetical protein
MQEQNKPKPYMCLSTERRWKRGDFDKWTNGRPKWEALLRTAYFGKPSRAYPHGGCHNCGGGPCTENTVEVIE